MLEAKLLCKDGTVIPFRLVLNGNEIRYEFSKPEQTIALRLGDENSRLEEVTKNGSQRVTAARLDDPVRNTDITYEDLALQFLYWKKAKIVDDDLVAGISCHKLELNPGRGSGSQYGTVWAWITKDGGALSKAECYGPDGKLVARFTFVSLQTLHDGTRFLKEMRIARFENGAQRKTSPTRLIIAEEGGR